MKQSLTTRRPETHGRRVVHGRRPQTCESTILVAGVFHSIGRLGEIASIERVPLRDVVAHAPRRRVDLVVIGSSSPPSDALDAIDALKSRAATAAIPVLHLSAGRTCGRCGAEVCLPLDGPAHAVAGVARALVRVHAAEARASGSAAGGRSTTLDAASERLLALGRMTGSVVHDSNNLLLVIGSHVELARRLIGAEHPAAERLATVLQAVERAGALNRQLLALGRGAPAPRLLANPDAVLAELEPMLRGLLGDSIRLELRTGAATGLVRADPGQLEQVLLNLVLNARDAMPDGGRLAVETQDVRVEAGGEPGLPPGRYVVLAVSDDGVGIDAAARERIFEPFFTTKAAGDGSGLGLASVRRVAEQGGGQILVHSEPGLGATFRVFLPRAETGDAPSASRRPSLV
jgi:signal transduction histidine kinase